MSDDLLNFLNDGPLLSEDLETPNIETLEFLTSEVPQPIELDHQYSMSPILETDGSVSSEGASSPSHSETLMESSTQYASSEGSQLSPIPKLDTDIKMSSPLGGGEEDLDLNDLMTCYQTNESPEYKNFTFEPLDTDSTNITLHIGNISHFDK